MAITPRQLVWRTEGGRALQSGRLHDLFGQGAIGGAVEYQRVEIQNTNASLTWSSPRLWLALDPSGVAVAVAVASASALASGAPWPAVTVSGLTYSAPTTYASGLTLPNLAPGQRALIAVRRTLTGSPVTGESNRLIARGTSPI
jgi:hypothetical protein